MVQKAQKGCPNQVELVRHTVSEKCSSCHTLKASEDEGTPHTWWRAIFFSSSGSSLYFSLPSPLFFFQLLWLSSHSLSTLKHHISQTITYFLECFTLRNLSSPFLILLSRALNTCLIHTTSLSLSLLLGLACASNPLAKSWQLIQLSILRFVDLFNTQWSCTTHTQAQARPYEPRSPRWSHQTWTR